jgi:dTDP-glucose 4,6-dehydratase
MKRKILITGGAGFIGSHVVRKFVNDYPEYNIYNLDSLTYAGNLENLRDVENAENYHFIKGDICNAGLMDYIFRNYQINAVIHLAAESHVDRSIENPMQFVQTNVIGTVNLLNAAKKYWEDDMKNKIFYHISTDEVYGTLDFGDPAFTEKTAYDPHSPYSAAKASSDHFVRAYHDTYGLPILISNCSNNYGPNQFPEKLIPVIINNILNKNSLPIYGEGKNVRDWLHVEDHAGAIDLIFHKGKFGETYNVGGNNEWNNNNLVSKICDIMDEKLENAPYTSRELITYVKDRAGHDLRYAIDNTKLIQLGWRPKYNFESGIVQTIEWYLKNQEWINNVTSGEYQSYFSEHYGKKHGILG